MTVAALGALWPLGDAHAARSCEEWSAEITAVEGRVEVRRAEQRDWGVLSTGQRVCSGDAIRSDSSSRATLTLPDGGTIRLDENSAMAVPEPPSGFGSLIKLLRGVIHIISRDPRELQFTTPYANAGLEGTEFDIRVDEASRLTEVIVLEGEVVVTTPAGLLNVASDYIAVAKEGEAPTASPYLTPIERMRWASYYPRVIDRPLPGADQEPSAEQQRDADFYARRAAARLATAGIAAAEADIASALRIAPRNATALSLRALLALARADRATARALLSDALAGEPASAVARLTLSLVEQSSAALTAAERTLQEALSLEPDNSIVVTRLAELALAQGDTRAAIATATRARSLAPTESAPLVVIGFANLRTFDTTAAQTAFATAVELEPAAPLPRLGLALTAIHRNDLVEGKRQLELAVALDPANPLTRSYMAKVYDALNRGDLTITQLELAKEFDPVDPTAWVYSSLQKLRTNQPIGALQDLRTAARKNGDEPIFRSWLPLDDDLATRSTGIGRVHSELGFGRLGLIDGWRAIGADPTNFAGHRLLADGYSTEPRHEIARVSELLISQLLQPANVSPVKPQLGQQNLFIAQRAGPSQTSFDELASPVVANGLKLRASVVAGGNGIRGDDVALAGLHDRVSYSVGHYRFATEGFRDNNDLEQTVTSAFVQVQPSHNTNLQAELRSARTEHGDLSTFFNRDFYSSLPRFREDVDSLRLGAKQQLTRNHLLLGSLILQDVSAPLTSGPEFGVTTKQRAHNFDVQHIFLTESLSVQSGLLSARQNEHSSTTLAFPGADPFVVTTDEVNRQLGFYSYARFSPSAALTVTAGASFDSIDSGLTEEDAVNPKVGVIWRPTAGTTVRAAAFETLYGSLSTSTHNAQPRLEPVHVAGFTQLLFGGAADRATVLGVALEQELSTELFVGWQLDSRETERTVPAAFPVTTTGSAIITLRERTQQAYLYWMPLEQLSVSARYERGRYDADPFPLFGYSHMKTARLPIEVRYFARGGLTLGARASHVHQEGAFQMEPALSPLDPPTLTPGEDRFWVMDAFVGYRLPNRRGLLSLNADNLLDEHFNFQDIDATNPSLFPERLISFRFTLAFD
jgi:tetratricopeptide (TPR) repeat protein